MVKQRQAHGRPRLTDACEERRLAREVRSNRRTTEVLKKFTLVLTERCQKTLCISLLCMRLHNCRSVRLPMLTPSTNTGLGPKAMIWSESGFLLHHMDGRCPYHLSEEQLAPGCTVGRIQAG